MNSDKSSNQLDDNDIELFRQSISGTHQIKQDKIQPSARADKQKMRPDPEKRAVREANFYFSDEFLPDFSNKPTLQYVQDGFPSDLPKRLRRGDFQPDLVLDLHGLRREQAKYELAGLIDAAVKQHVRCVCVVTGVGEGVLKGKTPDWLVQHPKIAAFHQAPLEWGGHGAILALIDLGDDIDEYADVLGR